MQGKASMVLLNDEINAARDVTKTTLMLQTRSIGDLGPIVSPTRQDRVLIGRLSYKHTYKSRIRYQQAEYAPKVDIVLLPRGRRAPIDSSSRREAKASFST